MFLWIPMPFSLRLEQKSRHEITETHKPIVKKRTDSNDFDILFSLHFRLSSQNECRNWHKFCWNHVHQVCYVTIDEAMELRRPFRKFNARTFDGINQKHKRKIVHFAWIEYIFQLLFGPSRCRLFFSGLFLKLNNLDWRSWIIKTSRTGIKCIPKHIRPYFTFKLLFFSIVRKKSTATVTTAVAAAPEVEVH